MHKLINLTTHFLVIHTILWFVENAFQDSAWHSLNSAEVLQRPIFKQLTREWGVQKISTVEIFREQRTRSYR